jgi:hypothetical protein
MATGDKRFDKNELTYLSQTIKIMEIKKLPTFFKEGDLEMERGCTIGLSGPGSTHYYNPLHPESVLEYITVAKIAKALSKICRYLGNTTGFYSVAQHSVRGAEAFMLMGQIEKAKEFLFHDAPETIYGDFSRPFKNVLKEESPRFKQMMDDIDIVLLGAIGLSYPHSPGIKDVDNNLALEELCFAMGEEENLMTFWSPDEAEKQFLMMYQRVIMMEAYRDGSSNLPDINTTFADHTSVLGETF